MVLTQARPSPACAPPPFAPGRGEADGDTARDESDRCAHQACAASGERATRAQRRRGQREQIPPPDPRLEAESDRLLAESAVRDGRGEYPFYSERWLLKRERWDLYVKIAMSMLERPTPTQARPVPGLTTLMNMAELEVRERQVLLLMAQGATERGIAARLGMSRGAVRTRMRRVRSKLRAAERERERKARERQRRGLITQGETRELFEMERDRFIYRRPICCRQGQEACRRTGLCDKRWYLFYA